MAFRSAFTLTQSAVAFWRRLPSSRSALHALPPTAVWLSKAVAPTLQDAPGGGSAYLEGHGRRL